MFDEIIRPGVKITFDCTTKCLLLSRYGKQIHWGDGVVSEPAEFILRLSDFNRFVEIMAKTRGYKLDSETSISASAGETTWSRVFLMR